MIVLDASAAVALLAPSQATAASAAFGANEAPWIAPAIFSYEIRHALLKIQRRTHLSSADVDLQIEQITDDLEWIDEGLDSAGFAAAMALAREGGLAFYDACYVELALREGAELASRDARLLSFAGGKGVPVHDLR